MDLAVLIIFIPTFFLVSITPGMCMTLAMTLGMSIGVRHTLWMMWGELLGVALVAIAAVIGVSTIMMQYPQAFNILKLLGASYLLYIGINMWRSQGKLSLKKTEKREVNKQDLFNQGLITAIANPKGWAFMVSLLPPFINPNATVSIQLFFLVTIILLSEFTCMMIYATGGKTMAKLLTHDNNIKTLNKISGALMMAIALWLALS